MNKNAPNLCSFYYATLGNLRDAYLENPNLDFLKFCDEHGVQYEPFRKWLGRRGLNISTLRKNAMMQLGVTEDQLRQVPYEKHLETYKKCLEHDINMRLTTFCRLHDVNYTHMLKWMNRQNLQVCDVQKKVRQKLGMESDDGQPAIPPLMENRLRSHFKKFKKEVIMNPQLSLNAYCRNNGVSSVMMKRWLKLKGISLKEIIKAHVKKSQMAAKVSSVFVQFQPNGMTDGDTLRGVVIKTPDGAIYDIEECTVVSLCNFISMYNSDQKAKNTYV